MVSKTVPVFFFVLFFYPCEATFFGVPFIFLFYVCPSCFGGRKSKINIRNWSSPKSQSFRRSHEPCGFSTKCEYAANQQVATVTGECVLLWRVLQHEGSKRDGKQVIVCSGWDAPCACWPLLSTHLRSSLKLSLPCRASRVAFTRSQQHPAFNCNKKTLFKIGWMCQILFLKYDFTHHYHVPMYLSHVLCARSLQSCLTLCNPMD